MLYKLGIGDMFSDLLHLAQILAGSVWLYACWRSHENINHTAMTVTTRKERHSVRPPVRHNWSLPGSSNQQLKKPFVFQHELLQNFSVSLFCKVCMLVFYNVL
jgi:hypothetical protein